MNARIDVWHRLRLIRSQAIRRSINSTIPVLERLYRHSPPLPDQMELYLERARRSTQLSDFGYPELATGLDHLLDSVIHEADLNYIGRKSFYLDTLRLLKNTLWLTEERKRIPEVCQTSITAPVFIMGLPRSASTFLQLLLIQDPNHRAPRVWETTYPHLDMTRGYGDKQSQRVQNAILWLDMLEPELQSAYPLHAESPQECGEILGYVFESLRFDTLYDVPSYLRWMDSRSHEEAYTFHRHFLQHLQYHRRTERWILKCPDHVFCYDDIFRVYPDARVIITHRDPAKVIPSVAALTMILQGLFSHRAEAERVANRVFERWVFGSRCIIDLAESEHAAQGQVLHVFYNELTSEPIRTLERIYAFLQTPFTSASSARIKKYLLKSKAGAYPVNRYSKQFEALLPAGLIRDRFQGYCSYFSIDTGRSVRSRKSWRQAESGPEHACR